MEQPNIKNKNNQKTTQSLAKLHPTQTVPQYSNHPAFVYLSNRGSTAARRTMKTALEMIADIATDGRATMETLPWWKLRYQHTHAIRARLQQLHTPATANQRLSALRGIHKTCWRMGLIQEVDYRHAVDFSNVKGSREMPGRRVTEKEIAEMLKICQIEQNARGARDGAIIALLYGCGLRRAEAASIDWQDYNTQDHSITIIGKGNKERKLYLPLGAKQAMAAWSVYRNSKCEAIFCPILKNGKSINRKLTDQAILNILRSLSLIHI